MSEGSEGNLEPHTGQGSTFPTYPSMVTYPCATLTLAGVGGRHG